MMDHAATCRTIAQHIQSVIHSSVRLRRQWCDERRTWTTEWNDILFTDESHFCLQQHDGRIRVRRHHAGVKNGRSLQGKLTDGTVVEVEAGASFYTDPSSDVRQMHMNVVKCSN
ncbi:transposable element Tc1 transposase [Trichonephila clavipes]|nr:transposable element Tc1 transposase [Trichonephila clavipes]